MMKPLRKRHFQVWLLLAFLVPAGIISGYMVIPGRVYQSLLQEDKTMGLPVLVNKTGGKDFSVFLRSSEDKKKFQLQWVSRKGSDQPSSLIYKMNNGEKELIGRIGTTGTYFFPLKEDPSGHYHFIVYDIIHGQTTESIKF